VVRCDAVRVAVRAGAGGDVVGADPVPAGAADDGVDAAGVCGGAAAGAGRSAFRDEPGGAAGRLRDVLDSGGVRLSGERPGSVSPDSGGEDRGGGPFGPWAFPRARLAVGRGGLPGSGVRDEVDGRVLYRRVRVDGGAVGLRRPSRGGGPVAVRGDDAAGGGARVRPAGRGGAGDVRGDLVGVDLQAGGLGSRRGGRFRVVAAVRGAAGPVALPLADLRFPQWAGRRASVPVVAVGLADPAASGRVLLHRARGRVRRGAVFAGDPGDRDAGAVVGGARRAGRGRVPVGDAAGLAGGGDPVRVPGGLVELVRVGVQRPHDVPVLRDAADSVHGAGDRPRDGLSDRTRARRGAGSAGVGRFPWAGGRGARRGGDAASGRRGGRGRVRAGGAGELRVLPSDPVGGDDPVRGLAGPDVVRELGLTGRRAWSRGGCGRGVRRRPRR